MMSNKLVIDGNTVYEIDEECVRQSTNCAACMWKSLYGPAVKESGDAGESARNGGDEGQPR